MMADDRIGAEFAPQTRDEWIAEVRRSEREGELFRAYDLARQGLSVFPDDLRLKHRAVLCLASTGARQQAAQLFGELGLAGHGNFYYSLCLLVCGSLFNSFLKLTSRSLLAIVFMVTGALAQSSSAGESCKSTATGDIEFLQVSSKIFAGTGRHKIKA